MPPRSGASRFWRFSLRLYAIPEMASVCLELQDRAGADVNILLYLLFLANEERLIGRDEVELIDAVLAPWRNEIVQKLRMVRRKLKSSVGGFMPAMTAGLRDAVKRIELQSERLAQEALERLAPPASLGTQAADRASAARQNLAAYGAFLGGMPEGAVATLLRIFAAAPDA
jgi:uncharacterized protein (TIGR02444 family)